MKLRLRLIVLALFCLTLPQVLHASTWFVRADGGTRYSVNMPTGQCDGLADAAYPGSGVDQHCAFGDYRFLWDDQSYGNHAWVIAGGDTVIVDNTQQWRVGFQGNGSSTDPWCYGVDGGPYGCTNPTIPAGTASQHTQILGRNYANCSTGNVSNRSAMTQIFGGHGVGLALNLGSAAFVDVECLEITRHSDCIIHGTPAYPSACNTNEGPDLDDYDSEGIGEDQGTHDVLLQDLWIHGHTDRGILGPIGGIVTANRVNVSYNGNAGWDFDTSSGSNDASVNGSLFLHYVTIEWNGCNQEYPAVDTYPAISCYSQSTGGYGDGIGTPSNEALNVEIDHSIFRYNTQDGEDFGHVDTGASTLSITDSYSYGNNGEQFKWGTHFASVVFENNLAIGNCLRLSQPFPGAPSTYNTNLEDFCRAGSTISFNFVQGETALLANNTIVSYAPSTFDFQCGAASCSTASMTLTNNIIVGYDNPATYPLGGQTGGPGLYCGPACNGDASGVLGTINRYNNSYYGIRGSCQAGVATESLSGTISGETCNNPLFVGEPEPFTTEAALDNYDLNLSAGSPAIGAGVAVAGLTTDYNGVTMPTPPSLGAIQVAPALLTPTLTFSAVANQTYGATPFAVAAASASTGAITYAVTSGPATISSGTVTLTGVGTVVLGATQAATSAYSAASATLSFTVLPALPSLTFAAVANQTYGNPAFSVSATSASTGAITYSLVSGPATLSGSTLSITGVGTVVIDATQAATTNYLPASATLSFTVAPAVPSLNFTAIPHQTYGNPAFSVSATSTSTGAITYALVSGPAALSADTVALTGAGLVVISASQAAATNYLPASATLSFTVAPAVPSLSFTAIPNQIFGNRPFAIHATSVSNGAITYAVASGPATLSGNTLYLTGVGTVVLSASQPATTNYLAASTSLSFYVAPAIPLLRFAPIDRQTFGNPPFTIRASSASNGVITYAVVSGPATLSGSSHAENASPNTLTLTGVGTVVLSASQAAAPNYLPASVTYSFSVIPDLPTLSFTAIPSQTFGNPPLSLSAHSASNGAITYAVVSGPATLSANTLSLTGAGSVILSASQAATIDYLAASASLSIPVAPALASLSFAAIPSQTFGNPPLAVSATSASTGAVVYAVVSGPATLSGSIRAATSGNTLSLTGAGTVVVSATQAATTNYLAASATLSFSVAPATPVLTFAAIPNQTVGAAPFAMTATSVSTGTVSYSVVSGPATVSGNLVTVTGSGTVVVGATQLATQNYTAATATSTFQAAFPFAFTRSSTTTSSGSETVTPGSPATFSFLLVPTGGPTFPDPISFSATGLPPGGTATFSPSTLAAGSKTSTVSLTIQTSSQAARHQRTPRNLPPIALGLLLLPMLGMRAARRRVLEAPPKVAILTLVSLTAAIGLSGCGSSSQTSTLTPQTYTVAVTATDQTTGWKTTSDVTLLVQ